MKLIAALFLSLISLFTYSNNFNLEGSYLGIAKYGNDAKFIGRVLPAGCSFLPIVVNIVPENIITVDKNAIHAMIKPAEEHGQYNLVIVEYNTSEDDSIAIVRAAAYRLMPDGENRYELIPMRNFNNRIQPSQYHAGEKSILTLSNRKTHHVLSGARITKAQHGEPADIHFPALGILPPGRDYQNLRDESLTSWQSSHQVNLLDSYYRHDLAGEMSINYNGEQPLISVMTYEGVNQFVLSEETNGIFALRNPETGRISSEGIVIPLGGVTAQNVGTNEFLFIDHNNGQNFSFYRN